MRAIRAGQDEIGPQIGFDEQREIGTPVIEESTDELWCVERNELMHGAGGQALFGERRRGNGAGGHEHGEVHRAKAFDQRNDGEQLADAGAVQPNERPRRARQARLHRSARRAAPDFPCRA